MKKEYLKPEIELIKLDNDISLQLSSNEDSDPSNEPDWISKGAEHFGSNPYKTNIG